MLSYSPLDSRSLWGSSRIFEGVCAYVINRVRGHEGDANMFTTRIDLQKPLFSDDHGKRTTTSPNIRISKSEKEEHQVL